VSILFPLPSGADEVDHLLAASSTGALGTLLPSELYSSVGPISGSAVVTDDAGNPVDSGFAAYADLHVVAMRIDPCFASLAPDPHGAGCTAQIRLVFQEVRVAGADGGASAFDSALHAFYSLTRGQFLALARALVALRVANAGSASLGPLAPHPIMASQGLGGALSTGVRQLVLQYAGEQNLTRVALLSLVQPPPSALPGLAFLTWSFGAADVTNAEAASTSPFVIPTLSGDGGGVTEQRLVAGVVAGSATFEPATTSHDDLTPLSDGMPGNLDASAVQAAFDSLVRVENPANNSPNTIDCASCHVATPTELLVVSPVFGLDDRTSALAFRPDGKSVVAADTASTFPIGDPPALDDVHAFSYLGQAPTISQRVVNETAAVVEYLNQLPE
jgi:hypothetical protein